MRGACSHARWCRVRTNGQRAINYLYFNDLGKHESGNMHQYGAFVIILFVMAHRGGADNIENSVLKPALMLYLLADRTFYRIVGRVRIKYTGTLFQQELE